MKRKGINMSTAENRSLEDLLASKPDLVDYFYNDTLAPHAKARGGLTPVPQEYSSWVEEQRAWRNHAILFDQSHHMPELFIKGPDAIKLLSRVGVNSFANFTPGVPKQFIGCNSAGQVIGECIVYCHAHDDFELVSGMPLLNWVEYNAKVGGFEVDILRDNHTAGNPSGKRVKFRFGMDGPNAGKIFAELIDSQIPEIKFFRTAKVRVDGLEVLALRHGMAGHQGVELSGRYEDGPAVRTKLLKVGEKYGLRQGGMLAYFSTVAESGWMASPFPAIFTNKDLKDYRKWLPATTWEAGSQLGGSYYSKSLEDYYVTPWDLAVDGRIKFDHDFIGRTALETLAAKPRRVRRTLVWNKEDVSRIFSSILTPEPFKLFRLPYGSYAYQQYDAVRTADGTAAGVSTFCGYTVNERDVVSLSMINVEKAEIGTELLLLWGEPNGGSRKPQIERHKQTEVRVTVAPAPYAETVRRIKYNTVGKL
jgi:vanillate/3-O-methylgallate O-demethylase